MTWVNGRIAASVGTADSYVSFPILYLFIFRKTLVAKIRIIFSDQAHSSLKKRGFAKIQNNDEPSTPTGVELQVTAHDTMCGSKCLPNPRPQRRSNLSTDYMVRPRWGRMYRSHLAIRKSLTLRLTGVRPFSGSVCLHTFILHKRLNSGVDFNERLGVDVTIEMLQEFANRLNWRLVSQSQKMKFTEELVRKYEDKWFWSELMRNIKFQEDIPDFENVFASHRSIVTFTDRIKDYRSNPCIYHFTHFYNAIDVIRNRKILSRDRAEELGLLKYDSAGSVVFRSSKAHKFARFYFRPCTPTQYYNEALGADSKLGEWRTKWYKNWYGEWESTPEWKSKYPKAVGLGLPKCPIPVFFRFDIDEVLAKIPEKCYYSDRNMQSDNPNIYKIIDRPESLGLEYLYSTMQDAYITAKSSGKYDREVHLNEKSKVMRYSQQEFLVMSEFDFSELKSLQIICYDSFYAELLKQIFADDPISEKIVAYCDESLFERENRRLNLSSSGDNVRLSTDFEDEYYFNITGEKISKVEFDLSACEVIYDTTNELRLKGTIAWKKTDIPFNISFVDPKARTKEWLVYQNI